MKTSGKTGDRQLWLKRVLVPFWVFQLWFMIILIGLSAWIISYGQSSNPNLVLIFACINTTLILSEILLFVRRRLQPLVYLVLQVIKTALWLFLFGMNVVGVVVNSRQVSALYLFMGIVQVTIVLLSFIGTLIYASVIYHRHRRGTPYHRSRPKSPPSFHSSSPSFIPLATEYPSPSTDYTSKPPYNRASTAAPEKDERMMSHNNNNDDQKIGELDYRDTEIRELHSPEEEEVVMGYEEEKWRELQGDERVFEMRADRSVKGSRRATGVDGEAETR